MNTCHFGGEIIADSSTNIAWEGGTSYQDNSIGKKDAQSVGKVVRHAYSFENRDWLPLYLLLRTA